MHGGHGVMLQQAVGGSWGLAVPPLHYLKCHHRDLTSIFYNFPSQPSCVLVVMGLVTDFCVTNIVTTLGGFSLRQIFLLRMRYLA